MKIIITSITILLSLVMITISCKAPELHKEMVLFDQAFIPAFYYTYTGDVDRAQTAMYPLVATWTKNKKQYAPFLPKQEDREESVRMIDAWLEEASYSLAEEDTEVALFQLDHARYELMDFRWRENIPYYLDAVWELEGAIDVTIETATDPMLDLREWSEFIATTISLNQSWEQLNRTKPDQQLYQFTSEEYAHQLKRKTELGQAIQNFIQAVESADPCIFAEAAEQMEPAYWNYLVLFGDFELSKTHYAALGF